MILKGDGVENVTFEQNDYSLTAATQASGRRSADTGSQTQRIAFGAADVQVGRVFTLTFDATSCDRP